MAKGDRGKPRALKTTGRKTGLTDEDVALFKRALSDVEPLREQTQHVEPLAKRAADGQPAAAIKDSGGARASAAAQVGPTAPRAAPALPDLDVGATAGVDRRTADRLRRGKLAIEARLDLHGLYQDEAHGQLNDFIVSAAAAGRRCVLVITGRGAGQEGGVLRRRVPTWLNQAPCRSLVLAMAPARRDHGGEGALYVLLRRRR